MEIIPGIHLIPGIIANPYLIVDADGLTLIDCGLPRSERKILTYITSLGYQPTDLKNILITHADGDHVGGLQPLQTASSAITFASQAEAQAIRQGRRSRPLNLKNWQKPFFSLLMVFFKVKPALVEAILEDGQILPILGGLQVVATPGHTPGHLSYYLPTQGVLFCGDSIRISNRQLQASTGINTWDGKMAGESAQKQDALKAKIICAGHGDILRK
jgi:glyoxylase-like metal-dependent hydrolase (beta-lactamase superfamily II)